MKEGEAMKAAADLWKAYQKVNTVASALYDAWAFGDNKEMANEFAELVLAGTKTATASSFLLYELENEPLPYEGLYNIILDGDDHTVAVVQTTDVKVIPFDEVTEEFAYLEGEGDRTLAYWRRVHEDFFKREFAGIGAVLHEQTPVVCEKFKVVCP